MRVADVNGLTNPRFEYQPQRVDHATQTDIPGAVSKTYTLTDNDVGKRIQLQVQFNDDEGTEEMRTGPATSVIGTATPRLLVGNLTRNVVGAIGAAYTQSTGLVTGSHEFGYAIEDVTAHRGVTGPLSDGDAEIRVYDSTSNGTPTERKPNNLIMTANNLINVNGVIVNYGTQSRVKLDPDTTYHIALAALSVGPLSCKTAHQTGVDSDSLAGFSIIYRTYQLSDEGVTSGQLDRTAIRAYADADLSHNRINNDQEHHVNAVPQLLSHRVSSKPAVPPWYAPGDRIEFTLEFSLPVTVVGDPQLEFSVTTPAPSNEFASYLSGSGTKELVFSYLVGAVDDDPDGIWWNEDSLRLDSDDSITGTYNGLDADLDHTEFGKLEDHRIDQNPRAASQEVTSDPVGGTNSDTYGAGDMITFRVVFNQAVTVNGTPRLRFSITGGTGDEYATYVSGNGTNTLVFSYTVLATEMDSDGIYLYKNPLDYPDANVDSIVGTSNSLDAVNDGIGKEGVLSGHKVDGSLTN